VGLTRTTVRPTVVLTMLLVVVAAAAGCATTEDVGSWSVQSVSPDGLTLHLGVNVSCNAKLGSSRVREYDDHVFVSVGVRRTNGECSSVLVVHPLDVLLKHPLRNRWVDGACIGGCPTMPRRAPTVCGPSAVPFSFGYLPSGWSVVPTAPAGVPAAFQNSVGNATIELQHNPIDVTLHVRTDVSVIALGNAAQIGRVDGESAVAFDVAGSGPGCGPWLLLGRGLSDEELIKIAGQLVPR
jgi:hypothetical protein